MKKCKVIAEEQGAREPKLKKSAQLKLIKRLGNHEDDLWIKLWQIREDNFLLQQVSIISHVGVAIPFRVSQQTSIRRVQVLIA